MTKVTNNTYSRAISGMNREMMKMDGRDNAEYQILEMKGLNGQFGNFLKSLKEKNAWGGGGGGGGEGACT